MSKLKRKPTVTSARAITPAPVTPDNVTSLFTQENVFAMGREYAELSAQIKVMEERRKFLSTQIKNGAEQFGTKDDKGSFYLENDDYVLGRVAKKSFSLNQDKAVSVLERSGLGDVLDVVKVVNEDRLNTAVQEGRIALNTVEGFTDCKISYSVKVDKKETVTAEVEQTQLSAAARKK